MAMNELGTSDRACELCDHQGLDEFAVPGSCVLWHCPACGLYQQGKPAEDAAYGAAYHQGYHKHRAKKVRTAMIRLNRLAPHVDVEKPRLLDIGCSVGCTVEAANRRGWQGFGVDVSDEMVAYCRKIGLNCHKTNSLRLPFADESFDIVTSWHVIEHVASVSETLTEWRRVIRPGGLLILETPDANCGKAKRLGAEYRKFWAAEHTYTFTPETLGPFIEQAGFEPLSRPLFGRLGDLAPKMAAYTVLYQGYHGLRHSTRIAKAFQVFARRSESKVDGVRRAA
jgi:SAM-dependent methyltransferase